MNNEEMTEIPLETEAHSALLGQDIAMALRPGDAVTLSGKLGAGKSTLARALLRALAGDPDLEVPSPTYALCLHYDLAFPVSHFDFYRMADAAEAAELGMEETLEAGAVVIEWPERAPGFIPAQSLHIEILEGSQGRMAAIAGGGSGEGSLAERFRRSRALRHFIDRAWGSGAERRFLQGDASSRRYETVHLAGEARILMDAPRRPDGPAIREGKPYSRIAHLAEDVVPFIAIGEALRARGLGAPEIHARDIAAGMLLTEHLGSERIVDDEGRPIADRYLEAARLLAHLHAHDWPREIPVETETGARILHHVPSYDRAALLIEASLLADWYAPRALGRKLSVHEREEFDAIWSDIISTMGNSMPTLVLRDFHSPNLIWRPQEGFPRRLGLIDFQDAVIGPQAYDLASIGQDARVDIAENLEEQMKALYISLRHEQGAFERLAFERDYAILAAHRATKILGIFVRLHERDGKPAYLKHLPRMQAYLMRSLSHPVLGRYREWCMRNAGFGGE
jgi:tRNA threonylcarbamoyl adenosine modification protein YjeE